VTMRRVSSNWCKNQIHKAFREVGRVIRTVALRRFLADSGLRPIDFLPERQLTTR